MDEHLDTAEPGDQNDELIGSPAETTTAEEISSTPEPTDPRLESVARSVAAIRDIDQAPLEEHAERYRAVHADLQQALSDTD